MSSTSIRRRDFLRRSAAIAGALTLPACAFAQAASAKDKSLRWGVIGTGHRATVAHIPAIKSFSDDMQIVAVCDVMENHLAAGAKRAGDVDQYSDYQKLLTRQDINAILIATPNLWHKEMVVAALDAGKHVMCEKPMAVTFEECKAMKAAAAQHPELVVLYTMQLRYSSRFAELRKTIESGRIGKLRMLLLNESRGDWNRGDVWQYDDPKRGKVNWRFSHAATGGTLNEKVCHYFDILHWMAGGVPQRVLCDGGISVYHDGRDTWDHATTTLTYPDEVKATHTLCMFGPHRLDLTVIGDEGSITLGEKTLIVQTKGKKPEELPLPDEVKHGERGAKKGQETAVLRMYEDFLDCVKNKRQPWMDADKAMASSKTAWLGELASEKKQEAKWDDIG
jgi:predicted dehydrogenase